MEPTFFDTGAAFRGWLAKQHDQATELWVGFHKTSSPKAGITWAEAVDQALCYGWIDGRRKSIDELSYMIRFTPRKPGSTWSAVNLARAPELINQGLMTPAGLTAYEARGAAPAIAAYGEHAPSQLPAEYEQTFTADQQAWAFFRAQAPSYQRTCIWWVLSAKQETTRRRRLATLIEDSGKGLKSGTFKRAGGGAWSDTMPHEPTADRAP